MRRIVFALSVLTACHRPVATSEKSPSAIAPPAPAPVPAAPVEQIRVEELAIPRDLPAFALRGNPSHVARYVFLGGRCTHPEGYIMAFAQAAAQHGDLVTLQGDVPCGGPFRRWSYDFPGIEKRIDVALAAAGVDAHDVTLIGYSQGAEIAERLAAKYPDKFTHAILMSSPIVPSSDRLHSVQAAVLMAGTRESQSNMRAGEIALAHAHIPATFLPIPGARHGELGNTPDTTMAGAFAWLDKHSPAPVTLGDLAR